MASHGEASVGSLLTVDSEHRVWNIPKSALAFCRHSPIRIPYSSFQEFLWHRRAVSDLFREPVMADEIVLVRLGTGADFLWASILSTDPLGVFAEHGSLGHRFLVFWPLAKALNAFLLRRDQLLPEPPTHPIDERPPCISYSSSTTLALGPVDVPGATLADPSTLTAGERLYASMIHAANTHGQRTTTSAETTRRRARTLLRTQTTVDPRHSLRFPKATVDRVTALKRDRDTTTSHFWPHTDRSAASKRLTSAYACDDASEERRRELLRRVLQQDDEERESNGTGARAVAKTTRREFANTELPEEILSRIVCTTVLSAMGDDTKISSIVLTLRRTSKALKEICDSFLAIQLEAAHSALRDTLIGKAPPNRAARAAQKLGLLLDDVAVLGNPSNLIRIGRGQGTLPLCKAPLVPSWRLYCRIRIANSQRYRSNTTTLAPVHSKPSAVYRAIMGNLSSARGVQEKVHDEVATHLDKVMMQKSNSYDTMLHVAGLL